MACYIVAYDLHEEGQNYNCLHKKLKAYPTHWHMQGSVWIVSTDETAKQIRDHLKPCLDKNDDLFVGKLSGEAAWSGYSGDVSEWLKKFL